MRIIRGPKKKGRGRTQTYLVEVENESGELRQQEMTVQEICLVSGLRPNTFYSRVRDEDIYGPDFFRTVRKKNARVVKPKKQKRGPSILSVKRLLDDDTVPADFRCQEIEKDILRARFEAQQEIKNREYQQALRRSYQRGGMNHLCNGRSGFFTAHDEC
jgi:hypothetical protein